MRDGENVTIGWWRPRHRSEAVENTMEEDEIREPLWFRSTITNPSGERHERRYIEASRVPALFRRHNRCLRAAAMTTFTGSSQPRRQRHARAAVARYQLLPRTTTIHCLSTAIFKTARYTPLSRRLIGARATRQRAATLERRRYRTSRATSRRQRRYAHANATCSPELVVIKQV